MSDPSTYIQGMEGALLMTGDGQTSHCPSGYPPRIPVGMGRSVPALEAAS